MWVLTDEDNAAGRATYGGAGRTKEHAQVMFAWDFGDASSGRREVGDRTPIECCGEEC
jgi:hypothetical protein